MEQHCLSDVRTRDSDLFQIRAMVQNGTKKISRSINKLNTYIMDSEMCNLFLHISVTETQLLFARCSFIHILTHVNSCGNIVHTHFPRYNLSMFIYKNEQN